MQDIEIPIGAQAYYSGNFYKFSGDRLFYFMRDEWRISVTNKSEVREHIRRNPSLLTSVHAALAEWDKC